MFSCVLIVPATLVDSANQLLEYMGWGPNNFSVPLTTDVEITHYGLHTWVNKEFVNLLDTKSISQEMQGMDEAELYNVMSSLIFSTRADGESHFQEILLAEGLSQVQV